MAVTELLQLAAGVVVAISAGRRVNAHVPGTPWIDRITWSIIGAAGLMACLGVPLARVPVVVESKATVVEHQAGVLRLHVVGRKPVERGMCELRDIDGYVIDQAGRHLEVPYMAEDDPAPGNTRPPGVHDFGVWRLAYPRHVQVSSALFVVHHRCAWWMPITRTQLGPIAVPPLM